MAEDQPTQTNGVPRRAVLTTAASLAAIPVATSLAGVGITEAENIGHSIIAAPAEDILVIPLFPRSDSFDFRVAATINAANPGGNATVAAIPDDLGDSEATKQAIIDAVRKHIAAHGSVKRLVISAHGDTDQIATSSTPSGIQDILSVPDLLKGLETLQDELRGTRAEPNLRLATDEIFLVSCSVFDQPEANIQVTYGTYAKALGKISACKTLAYDTNGARVGLSFVHMLPTATGDFRTLNPDGSLVARKTPEPLLREIIVDAQIATGTATAVAAAVATVKALRPETPFSRRTLGLAALIGTAAAGAHAASQALPSMQNSNFPGFTSDDNSKNIIFSLHQPGISPENAAQRINADKQMIGGNAKVVDLEISSTTPDPDYQSIANTIFAQLQHIRASDPNATLGKIVLTAVSGDGSISQGQGTVGMDPAALLDVLAKSHREITRPFCESISFIRDDVFASLEPAQYKHYQNLAKQLGCEISGAYTQELETSQGVAGFLAVFRPDGSVGQQQLHPEIYYKENPPNIPDGENPSRNSLWISDANHDGLVLPPPTPSVRQSSSRTGGGRGA